MNGWLIVAALNGFIAVAAGAFGAHGLRGSYDAQSMSVFETGALYHMFHALAIGIAAIALRSSSTNWPAWLFLAGIVLFCGSLYSMALSGVRAIGIVTPFGGLAFLAGWAALAYAAWKTVQ
ncbi:MAG TPA: DUF423 domain-containing protein [Rhizomicrobium sp.]|nr:DUF423 domain-containing protein [Rhizomicrobium sp.]